MNPAQFIMLGGFLGAGKTTTIARLARMYQALGKRVAIVTNDQASDLVDTHFLRTQGFDVSEVAGSCFCCNFNELTRAAESFPRDQLPEVIFAEPVGSCTDLVATVVQPLLRLYEGRFEVAPYGVLLKPSHGRRILRGEPNAGFSPKAAYIFQKQLEEADFIAINRIDELSVSEIDELSDLLEQNFPGIPQIRTSARTGEGFDALVELLDQHGTFGRRILDLDYDIYAEGEAELGWLNSTLHVQGEKPFSLDQLLTQIVEKLRLMLAALRAEVAHLKAIGLFDEHYAVANLVATEAPVQLSLASGCQTSEADFIVNARVAIAPEKLTQVVHEAVHAVCGAHGATAEFRQTQSFRPGRPVPTYRFAEAK